MQIFGFTKRTFTSSFIMSIYALRGYLVRTEVLTKIDSLEKVREFFQQNDVSLVKRDDTYSILVYSEVCLSEYDGYPDVTDLLLDGRLQMEFFPNDEERLYCILNNFFCHYNMDVSDYEEHFDFGIYCQVV